MEPTKVTAIEIKLRFGKYLDAAISQPVFIMKSGREAAVLLSQQRYEELKALEDLYWAEKAIEGEKSGYIGTEKSMKFLIDRLEKYDAEEVSS